MTLTGGSSPAECRRADADRIEHHRLAILVRVTPRSKHPIERIEGPEIDKQAAGYTRKVSLFLFCIGHDGRSAKRERDIGRLRLDDVIRDLVALSVSAPGASVYSDSKGGGGERSIYGRIPGVRVAASAALWRRGLRLRLRFLRACTGLFVRV
jgi:hypothetical protein